MIESGNFERTESAMTPVPVFVRFHNTKVSVAPIPPVDKEHALPITPMPKLMRKELGIDDSCSCGSCTPDRHHVWWERERFSKTPLKKLRSHPKFVTEIADCEHDALHIAQAEPTLMKPTLLSAFNRQASLEAQLTLARSRIIIRRSEDVLPESPKRTVKTLDQLEEEQDRLAEKLGLCIRTVGDLLAPQYYVVENGGIVIYTCTRNLPEASTIDPS